MPNKHTTQAVLDLMRSEIPRLFLLPLSPHLCFCSPHSPLLFILSIPRLCAARAPSPLVFPTLPHSAETHKRTRAAPKQRGKSWPGRWHDPLLVQRWDLRLSTRTRALFLQARRRRKISCTHVGLCTQTFQRPGYTLIQTRLGCFLPLPRST